MKEIAIKTASTVLVSLITWYVTDYHANKNASQVESATRFVVQSILNQCKE